MYIGGLGAAVTALGLRVVRRNLPLRRYFHLLPFWPPRPPDLWPGAPKKYIKSFIAL